MNKIDIDNDVYRRLGEIAIPFKETTPNMVLRRLLDLPEAKSHTSVFTVGNLQEKQVKFASSSSEPQSQTLQSSPIENCIEKLRSESSEIHPAFLTFLMDKYNNTKGNYKTSNIIEFMEKINLKLPNGTFRNPWMKSPYGGQKNGLISCQRTIEHFKQTRKFGCWGGKDTKVNCDSLNTCDYHPDNKVAIKNKCDLRNGVIWKRDSPDSIFNYGHNYLKVVKKELLKNCTIPLKSFLKIVYFGRTYDTNLIEQFKKEFHLNNDEFQTFFST
nr:hypothetical protein [uncultured Desulfobacter sp.]